MPGLPIPKRLLQRIAEIPGEPSCIALCPDFESGRWRAQKLAEHLIDWLPDVALRPRERIALLWEPNKTLAAASRRMFDTSDPSRRGEIGEVILHAACRQEFGTEPIVTRMFYKMRTNDSITSIDVAHVLHDVDTNRLELWLGEAKFYDDVRSARYRAFESIEPLFRSDFLSELKALIGPKIEMAGEVPSELIRLFEDEASLDQIVQRLVIPICLAADFGPTSMATTRTEHYIAEVENELRATKEYFQERVPITVTFVVIFVPMNSKSELEAAINARVSSYL